MDIKPILLLAMALFLLSAPDPDSNAVAEMTANFIVPSNERALQAAEFSDRREESEQASAQDSDEDSKDLNSASGIDPQEAS